MNSATENTGLPSVLRLEDGKFQLKGGTEKIDDAVGLLVKFIGHFRFFSQDFVLNPYQFYQSTSNYFLMYRDSFRLQVIETGRKYVKGAEFIAADIPIDMTDRKRSSLYIQYRYILKNESDTLTTIKKVII